MLSYINGFIIIHLTFLFFLSALGKLFSLRQFNTFVNEYKILPRRLTNIISPLIPLLELLGALLILLSHTVWFGLVLLAILVLVFITTILFILKEKRDVYCGCYGRWINAKVDLYTLFKNIYLSCLIIFLSLSIPSFGINYSFISVLTGGIVTAILLSTHYYWQIYKERLKKLHEVRS
ncbi:MauE/DoxX family redox-associated membrane protein [Evansella sp. AB-rgal1]|uniref:MauE/DoxX family redox-associated membrane protein n=1 Tax=Evansella sp. AB-rgal1 TaxID=3242696 RepID=UPI00359CE127